MMPGQWNPTSDDMASIGRAVVEAINELRGAIQAFSGLFGVVTSLGAFTTTAAATMVIPDPNVVAGSVILIAPAEASAATLQSGAAALYVDRAATVPGVSFTVKTADGSTPSAGIDFVYAVYNPIS